MISASLSSSYFKKFQERLFVIAGDLDFFIIVHDNAAAITALVHFYVRLIDQARTVDAKKLLSQKKFIIITECVAGNYFLAIDEMKFGIITHRVTIQNIFYI